MNTKQNIINYFKHNNIEFTYERKLLCDEFCQLKEFRSNWVKEMVQKYKLAQQTVYTFKNHMIAAKILKPPTDFTINKNQKEIEEAISLNPIEKDIHHSVLIRIENSYK